MGNITSTTEIRPLHPNSGFSGITGVTGITGITGVPSTPSVHRNYRVAPRRDVELITKRVLAPLRMLVDAGYFSFTVEGMEHFPRSGPVICIANHGGWFTLDSFFGVMAVADHVGPERIPWGSGQDELFRVPALRRFFDMAGVFPASWLREPERLPPEMRVLCVYPEGAAGSCKSFVHAYQMREWHTGFLRLALALDAPIVPAAFIGGEESFPSWCTLRFAKSIIGTIAPLPLSLFPLPSRWRMIVQKPIYVSKTELDGYDNSIDARRRRGRYVASEIRESLQRVLDKETADRRLARLSRFVSRPFGDRALKYTNS